MTEARWDSHEALIADLRSIVDKHAQPDPSTLAKLPKPTKKDNEKGSCSVCGGWHGLPAIHLDFMGHAEVTLALLDADPMWQMAFVSDEFGLPIITKQENRYVMWGTLTVCSITRPCVGTCELNKPEPEKELIGDLLRNGAMRFGIGTKLWSKATDADAAGSSRFGEDKPRAAKPKPQPETPGLILYKRLREPMSDASKTLLAEIKERYGLTLKVVDLDANPEFANEVRLVLDGTAR